MLTSNLLAGNARLQQAANGPPSIRKRPPDDDNDAVRRIQKALAQVGYSLPKSFKQGPNADPDGLFGPETESAVRDFQKSEFPGQFNQWDGRCGPNTLGAMDGRLADQPAQPSGVIECAPAAHGSSGAQCMYKTPAKSSTPPPSGTTAMFPKAGLATGRRQHINAGTPWAKLATKLKKKIK